MLKARLAHPRTRGLDLDDPQTTLLRRRIIREKKFLERIYREWYTAIRDALPPGAAPVLELGSGAGFLREFLPGLITSEILRLPQVRVVLDGQELPFAAESLEAVVMTNVLHHLPRPRRFLAEAGRCVRPGGVMVMWEPWVSSWSRFVYGRLHPEPFEPEAAAWEFPLNGPLSGANAALPWIIFARDRARFEREFPQWRIHAIRPAMPFRYLLSGGVSLVSLCPDWTFGFWRGLEHLLQPLLPHLAMFALIVLERQEPAI
jgi:SAM-dependent methyltransferase